ncbi:MAG: SDR family oxidoreductase [Halocynthiibacter sp.]
MTGRLESKVAFITGGNSGIGLASAKAFVAEGARVALLVRDQAKADAALAEIGAGAQAFIGDVTDLVSLRRAFDEVKKEHGHLDIVLVSAGIAPPSALQDATPDYVDHVFDVNFKGAFFTVQYALPMLAPDASFVLVGSCVAEMGSAGFSVYSASKAALRALARSLTPDLHDVGARINVLSPGPVDTDVLSKAGLSDEQVDATNDMFSRLLPAGRVGQPDELAAAAVFLASSESSFMRGSDLQVDGGMNQVRMPRVFS